MSIQFTVLGFPPSTYKNTSLILWPLDQGSRPNVFFDFDQEFCGQCKKTFSGGYLVFLKI